MGGRFFFAVYRQLARRNSRHKAITFSFAENATGRCQDAVARERSSRGLVKTRQRAHKSRAASVHVGNSNLNPESNKRPGTTLRLFRTNSDSVRIKNVPISSSHRGDGKPIRMPHASRNVRMNSA